VSFLHSIKMPEINSKAEHVVGVDLGATKILAGVYNLSLACAGVSKLSTKPQRGPATVIKRIARCVVDAVDESDLEMKQVRGVGIGAPGSVDGGTGTVIFAPNLEWRDVPLKKELEDQLGVPVFVGNDCSIAMLGIYVAELESKPQHVVGVFLGTGIGGGLVINGKPYYGSRHNAGEIGHMVLDVNGPKCGCGNKGCFEALASRTAIFQRIKAGVKAGHKTILTEMLGDNLKDLRSGDLRKAIRRGDKFVDKVIEEAAEYTGIAVGNLLNIFNPDMVVLGGGVIEALADEMMAIIIETARDYAMPGTAKGVEIFASSLGDNAAITGGAVLARQSTR
jgi:glucokinase